MKFVRIASIVAIGMFCPGWLGAMIFGHWPKSLVFEISGVLAISGMLLFGACIFLAGVISLFREYEGMKL